MPLTLYLFRQSISVNRTANLHPNLERLISIFPAILYLPVRRPLNFCRLHLQVLPTNQRLTHLLRRNSFPQRLQPLHTISNSKLD